MARSVEQEVLEVLERFVVAFANRDTDALLGMVEVDDLVVVTSEKSLLRGLGEFRQFLDRYVKGPTTYSWEWDRCDVSITGMVAWLLAEGTETATTGDHLARHPYRMTMVLERRDGAFVVRQVHGSSPH